jgi:hypothetical protein
VGTSLQRPPGTSPRPRMSVDPNTLAVSFPVFALCGSAVHPLHSASPFCSSLHYINQAQTRAQNFWADGNNEIARLYRLPQRS